MRPTSIVRLAVCGLSTLAVAQVASAGPVFYLPNGSGGFNAYEIETGAATLPTAFSTAAGRTFPGSGPLAPDGGVTGHVTTVRSAAHNTVLNSARGANFGGNSMWIGLSDDPTLVAGASEAGNTSGQPLPAPGVAPVAGERGFGYGWQSGESFTYQNWGGGEPNNAGTGENGGEMTSAGTWNDNGPPNQAALTRQYIVEYNTNLASRPGFQTSAGSGSGGAGVFDVVGVYGVGTLNNIRDFQAILRGATGTRTNGTAAVINYNDPSDTGGGGKFGTGSKTPFPGDTAGAQDDFGLLATGTIRIPSDGTYTFGFSGDDGSHLRILGADFTAKTGGGTAAGDTVQFDGPTGDSNTLASTFLAQGDYPIQYLFFERGGGAFTELYAGPGTITDRADANLKLIGDTANGGLQLVAVPEPASLGLLGVAGLALLRRRRTNA